MDPRPFGGTTIAIGGYGREIRGKCGDMAAIGQCREFKTKNYYLLRVLQIVGTYMHVEGMHRHGRRNMALGIWLHECLEVGSFGILSWVYMHRSDMPDWHMSAS